MIQTFADDVDKRFQAWIFRHIASSCCINRDDFDYAELADKGGLQKTRGSFGKERDALMNEMNMELVV